jgi:nucleoside transporter
MKRPLQIQLAILMFFQYFIWGGWYVTTGTYLITDLQFNGAQIGLVYGATAIAAFVSPFLSGILADRLVAVEKLLGIFHGVGGLLLLWASFLKTFGWFYPVLLLYTFLFVPTFALSSSLVFHHVVDRAKDYSRIRVWGTLGWIVAGVLVSYLHWEHRPFPMRLSAIASVVIAIYCFFLPHTPPIKGPRTSLKDLLGKEAKALFFNRAFLVFIIGMTLVRIPASFYYSFVNPYLYEIGVANPAGKMSMGQGLEIFLMITFPFVYHKLGLKKVLLLGMFAWGFRYLLFGYGDADGNIWMIYLAILLHGVTYNYTSHTGQIYMDQSVPPHLRSTAQGFMAFLIMGVGALAGSIFSGYVVDQYTLENGLHLWKEIFWYPAAIGLLTTLGFAIFFWPKKRTG